MKRHERTKWVDTKYMYNAHVIIIIIMKQTFRCHNYCLEKIQIFRLFEWLFVIAAPLTLDSIRKKYILFRMCIRAARALLKATEYLNINSSCKCSRHSECFYFLLQFYQRTTAAHRCRDYATVRIREQSQCVDYVRASDRDTAVDLMVICIPLSASVSIMSVIQWRTQQT